MSFKEQKVFTFDDIAKRIFSGGTPSTTNSEYWGGEYNWLSSGETRNPFIFYTENKITQKGIQESSTRLAKKGDTVIASAGQGKTRGQVSLLEIDTYINQSIIAISPNTEIVDPLWIFYNLSNRYDELRQLSDSSSIRGSLTTQVIRQMNITVPPIEVQSKFVTLLRSLDNKIEINRQTNATLETIAQTIFEEWFVIFNFPGATGEMIESELGIIPQGWKIRSLYDSATYINGAAYKNIPFSPDKSGLPVIKINELKYGITPQTNFTTAELESKYKIENGEILFSWSGSPDTSLDIFVWSGGSAWLNQHIFRVLPHHEFETHYIYYRLKHLKPVIIEIARDKQTTGLGHITVQDMKRMQVLYPPESVLQAFSKMVAPIYDRIFVSELESRSLIEIREILLPKLMSGEISVSETNK